MAAHSSILAWRIPWTEEPGSLGPQCCKESDTTEATEQARQKWLQSAGFCCMYVTIFFNIIFFLPDSLPLAIL